MALFSKKTQNAAASAPAVDSVAAQAQTQAVVQQAVADTAQVAQTTQAAQTTQVAQAVPVDQNVQVAQDVQATDPNAGVINGQTYITDNQWFQHPVDTNLVSNAESTDPVQTAKKKTGKNDPNSALGELQADGTYKDARGRIRRPMKRYSYEIKNGVGKKEKGNFDAESEDDVRSFLLSCEYEVLSIKERSSSDIDIKLFEKLKAGDLSFSLTQLATYIRAGIPLVDSMRILAKQATKPFIKKSYSQLVYELLKGENLSDAMLSQGTFYPQLLINMVKTSEMTGDLPSILDDMAEYYTSMDQTRKEMKSALTYPAVVLTIAFAVLIFMLTYLVPQFSSMFEGQGAELPAITRTILAISDFIKTKWWILLIVIVGSIVAFTQCFKRILPFRVGVQTFLMHLPVIKDIIIYNEISNFTKTFASLINHGVFITDSMEILSKITNNEIYKGIINKCLVNLSKGDTVSSAFRGEWAVPVVAYEMIVTGETTGQLGQMMDKVATHFQHLHKSVIDSMKSLLEPFLICFLAVVVGVILISIVEPMFAIYNTVQ